MIYVHPRLANQHQAIICSVELICQIIFNFGRGLLIGTMAPCPSQSCSSLIPGKAQRQKVHPCCYSFITPSGQQTDTLPTPYLFSLSFLVTETQVFQEDNVFVFSARKLHSPTSFYLRYTSVVNFREMRYKHNCVVGFLSEQLRNDWPLLFSFVRE